MLSLARDLVVVAFYKMDCLARQPFSISSYLLLSSHTEVAEKLEDIVRLCARIHSLYNHIVHLLCVSKGAVAVANDIEMSEVEVGSKPEITHNGGLP